MKLNRSTAASPLGEAGFRYEQKLWGDLIHGTKEQLQRIGLAVGMAFPGDPDGPKKTLKTTDQRGLAVRIEKGSYYGEGIYSASVSFPGRNYPSTERWIDYAPGVRKNIGYWCDEYVGTAVALNNAGLVRLEQLPGQPGMRKTNVTIFPDGTIPTGASASFSEAKQPGAKSIKRASKNTYMVSAFVSDDEHQRRDCERQRKDSEWEDRMRAMSRPAPLISLFDGERLTPSARRAPRHRAEGNVLYLLPRSES
ncbi:MAG: hypothetical protein M0P95_13870 [Sulfuritalea sp.]|jgi:hypothetical protein|nr:hypothetical protein [Sulfuritalea sp.]